MGNKHLLLLLLCIFIVFLPSINGQFLNWDDLTHLVNHEATNGISITNIRQAFSETIGKIYIPLTTLSFAIERHVFGLNPLVFHLTNIGLHMINSFLVIAIAMRLGVVPLGAIVAGFIFALHPMKVESVAWITERKDVLCALFYFLAIRQWLIFRISSTTKNLWLTFGFSVLSLLAKPMALSLPVALAVIELFNSPRLDRKRCVLLGVLAAVLAPLVWMTYCHHVRFPIHNPFESLLIWAYTFAFYPFKWVLPFDLTPIYVLPQPIALTNPIYASALIFVTAFFVGLWRLPKKSWVVFPMLFYVATMFFVFRFDEGNDINIVADRFLYIPSLMLSIACGVWFARFWQKARYLFFAMICVWGVIGIHQCAFWQNTIALWTQALAINPKNTIALNDRAEAYFKEQAYDLSIADYTAILKIKPGDADTHFNRGIVYQKAGNHVLATDDFTRVIAAFEWYDKAYNHRGISLLALGRLDQAFADFNEAIKRNPTNTKALFNRGLVHQKRGHDLLALNDYDAVLAIAKQMGEKDSDQSLVYNNRGIILVHLKRVPEAIESFKRANALDQSNQEAQYNLKVALTMAQQ